MKNYKKMLFRKTENIVKMILLEVKEANLIGVSMSLTMHQNITGKGQGNISLR